MAPPPIHTSRCALPSHHPTFPFPFCPSPPFNVLNECIQTHLHPTPTFVMDSFPPAHLRSTHPFSHTSCFPSICTHTHTNLSLRLFIICSELVSLYEEAGRRLLSDVVCAELVHAAAWGPRASDKFTAVAAACVCALAGSCKATEILANFLSRCVCMGG